MFTKIGGGMAPKDFKTMINGNPMGADKPSVRCDQSLGDMLSVQPGTINHFHNYGGGTINVFGSGNSVVFKMPRHTELNDLLKPVPGERLCAHHEK